MSRPSTVERILDSAEILFAEHGFAETSLRAITSDAKVNLAAVNYHFGSKKELIQAVFGRFLDPFMAGLDQSLEDLLNNNKKMGVEEVLELLVNHILTSKPRQPNDIAIFMKLMGLAYTQNQGHLKRFLTESYGATLDRYFEMLYGSCPGLPVSDMFWRSYFILGSAIFSMSGSEALLAIAKRDHGIDDDIEAIMRRMIPFMAAGLRAHATYDEDPS